LPHCRSTAEHEMLLRILNDIVSDIKDINYSYIVWGGDMNCNVLQSSAVSNLTNENMCKLDLILCNSLFNTAATIDYTFVAASRSAFL